MLPFSASGLHRELVHSFVAPGLGEAEETSELTCTGGERERERKGEKW